MVAALSGDRDERPFPPPSCYGFAVSQAEEARLDHHARMLVVATSFVEKTVTCGRRLVLLNRHAISARRGLIVSGLPGTGKTIAITQLGRAHELLDQARHPGVPDRIPVLYITVPPAATARTVAAEFARFLGLPIRSRLNMTDIIEAVVGVCTDTRTEASSGATSTTRRRRPGAKGPQSHPIESGQVSDFGPTNFAETGQ